MARGGKRPGAGRRPGQANKLTARQKRTLTDIARDHTEDAMQVLVDIMSDVKAPAAARASAANSVIDRGWGKPAQSHEHTGAGGGPIQTMDVSGLTDEQLAALYAAIGGPADVEGGYEGFGRTGDDEAGG